MRNENNVLNDLNDITNSELSLTLFSDGKKSVVYFPLKRLLISTNAQGNVYKNQICPTSHFNDGLYISLLHANNIAKPLTMGEVSVGDEIVVDGSRILKVLWLREEGESVSIQFYGMGMRAVQHLPVLKIGE